MSKKNTEYGFTLVEAIVAIAVISIGFVGSLVLLSRSSSLANSLKDRVVAAHLAEEGVEIVINIRDTNWLKGLGWRTGLPDTGPNFGAVDYDGTAVDMSDTSESRKCLNWDGNFYRHAVAPAYSCNTSFKRQMKLATLNENIGGQIVSYLEVKSIVEWKEKGVTKSLTVISHLYDWK